MKHPFDEWWDDYTTTEKSQYQIAKHAWNAAITNFNKDLAKGLDQIFPKTEPEKKIEPEQPLQYELHLT